MSQRTETLDLLNQKLAEIRETIDLISLIDCVTFFGFTQLLEAVTKLEQQVDSFKTQFTGGFISLLERRIKPALTSKTLTKKINHIFTAS